MSKDVPDIRRWLIANGEDSENYVHSNESEDSQGLEVFSGSPDSEDHKRRRLEPTNDSSPDAAPTPAPVEIPWSGSPITPVLADIPVSVAAPSISFCW